MQIKRIDPKTFENFDRYLLALPVNEVLELNDLCKIEMDGKIYIIGKNNNKIFFVENNDGELNPFEIGFDKKGNIDLLKTEEFRYLFGRSGYDEFVQKGNNLTCATSSLGLSKNTDDSCLEYRQYIQYNEYESALLINYYQIGKHDFDLKSALSFTEYHLPTQIELHLQKNGYFSREKIKFFYLDESAEKYFRAFIVSKNNYHLTSLVRYDGIKLLNLISEAYGFNTEIDDDLKLYIHGRHQEYNKSRRLVDNYHQFLLSDKII